MHNIPLLLTLAGLAIAQDRVCNSSPSLCSRAYNNITHLGAHDSPFVRNATNGYSVFGDQFFDSWAQLDSGVRLLSGQIHMYENDYHLCHTACNFLDAGLVSDWLAKLKGWLDSHPTDVVTILLVNSDNANANTLNDIWTKAGIVDYGYVPPSTSLPQKTWPTLNEMIDSGKRLVSYIATLPSANNTVAPYLLDEFIFAFENPYTNDSPQSFNCDVDRPARLTWGSPGLALESGYLALMNHFLYDNVNSIEFPSVENIQNTNADSGSVGNLGAAADNCTRVYGQPPTYILADFVNVGPALDTVDRLNGIASGEAVGRTMLPATTLATSSAAGTATSTSASLSSQHSGTVSTTAVTSGFTRATTSVSSGTSLPLSSGESVATSTAPATTPLPSTGAAADSFHLSRSRKWMGLGIGSGLVGWLL